MTGFILLNIIRLIIIKIHQFQYFGHILNDSLTDHYDTNRNYLT